MPAETEWQRRTRREHERARYIEAHGNFCELCRNEAKSRGLSEDHDHKTGAHRGWLCFRCNRALPAYVTLEWLLRAALYLTPPYLEWLRKDLTDLSEQVAAITSGSASAAADEPAHKRPASSDGMGRTPPGGRATQDPEIGASLAAADEPGETPA